GQGAALRGLHRGWQVQGRHQGGRCRRAPVQGERRGERARLLLHLLPADPAGAAWLWRRYRSDCGRRLCRRAAHPELEAGVITMSSEMNPYMAAGGSVVAYAPASSANLSVGFDVLGAALAPVDGSLLGDRVQVKAADVAFALSSVGRYAHKLPDDPKKNILYDCWVAYGEALEKRGLTMQPLEMVLEKNLPVGSGLGSSACSVVAALEGLNAFHGSPLNEHDMLLLMGEMEGRISGSVHYDNVAPCYL